MGLVMPVPYYMHVLPFQNHLQLIHFGRVFFVYNMFFEITREFTEIDFLFLGHTHKPLHIVNEGKHLLNPGSVGQPRDNDPRASYLTFKIDEETKGFEYEHIRLEYDVELTCNKMEELGFHHFLINRLKKGI